MSWSSLFNQTQNYNGAGKSTCITKGQSNDNNILPFYCESLIRCGKMYTEIKVSHNEKIPNNNLTNLSLI